MFFMSGVAAQETFSKRVGDTYIPASYIKYLEQAGARVVPIRYVQFALITILQHMQGLLPAIIVSCSLCTVTAEAAGEKGVTL